MSPAGQVGRVVELVGITPDGSALISVSARCSALAKFSSSALPRTKYVAAARAMAESCAAVKPTSKVVFSEPLRAALRGPCEVSTRWQIGSRFTPS